MTLEPAHCAAPRAGPGQGTDELSRARRWGRGQWQRRRRLERQLHDGAALRISALALQLGLFRHRVLDADPDLHGAIDGLQDELHAVLQELRDVAGQIYPPLLDEAGLGPALGEVADRIGSPMRVHAPADRFGPAAEGAAYFALADCLAAIGPGGPPVDVVVRRDGEVLVVDVRGVDVRHAEAMLDQLSCLGGTIDVTGGPHTGTITARIPCE
ncbi:histidine kinase [Pseudonocardia nigra]|uniref:histidine kinase n=1 Tax=Pseudonocardia nigra TaxID=1921578 RepID=UPI001C5E8970|nr:histidine kinase dimerization/phosphoacceptor domain-containing protein [Pseudonocardia nigra]